MNKIVVTSFDTKGYGGVLSSTHSSIEECNEYFKNRPGLTCLHKIVHEDGTVTAWEGCKIQKD